MNSPEPRGLLKALWSMYLEFAVNTGIHGLKYITEDGRRLVERLLWIVVAACGLIGAIFMASNFWLRFSNSPTRASVETNHYPTWRVPFPAVTLCNANRIFRSKAEELLDSIMSLLTPRVLPEGFSREDAMEMFGYIQQLIQPLPENNVLRDKEGPAKFQALLESYNYTVDEVMTRLDQGCETMLQRCKWKGVIRNCNELFEERKSFIGYCCSFNYRAIKENKTSNGTVKLVEIQRPVQRTRYYSHRMGLTVLLNPEINDYFHSTLFSAGIRMLVHSTDEYPDDAALEKILPVSRELLLRVTATSTYCTEAVRQVAPSIRGCVFPGEVKLNYFPLYSATNCLTECRMAYLHSTCNCTPFYYPSTGEFRTCNLLDIDCLNNHYFTLHTRKDIGARWTRQHQTTLSCDCPALCNDVSYDVQFSTGDFKASQFQRSSFFDDMNITDRILFHFYFGNHVTVRTRRDIISSWNDLLSSLGGVFSLFLGCSFMSVIEIIYFFTLRLYLRYRSAQSVDPVENVGTLHGRVSGIEVETGVAVSVLTGEPNSQRRNVLTEAQEEYAARHRFF